MERVENDMNIETEFVTDHEPQSISHAKVGNSDLWSLRFRELLSSEEPSADAVAAQIANQYIAETPACDWLCNLVESSRLQSPQLVGTTLLHHLRQTMKISQTWTPSAQEATFVLVQYTPQAMLTGALLQKTFHATQSGTELAAVFHRMHQAILRQHHRSSNRHECYSAMLQLLDVYLPPLGSARLQGDLGIQELSFELPTIDLAMSRFPDRFMPEILGACLYDAARGVPSIVRAAVEQLRATGKIIAVDLFPSEVEQQRLLDEVLLAITLFIRDFKGNSADLVALIGRIYLSTTLRARSCSAWSEHIASLASRGYLQPRARMLRMLQGKSKYAVGYHSHLRLGKCPFDQLLVQNPRQFMSELAASRYIVPGEPDRSALLTSLVAPKGKMFRIFQPDELDVIRAWVSSLAPAENEANDRILRTAGGVGKNATISGDSVSYGSWIANTRTPERANAQSVTARDMYYRLLPAEQDAEIRPLALDYALRWLRLSERQIAIGKRPPPLREYNQRAFNDWFDETVSKQIASYHPKDPKDFKSRDCVVDEAVQLCPLVMIDGAWLQGWCGPGLTDTPIGRILYTIYSDEIGNGDTSLNHPNIYRTLMNEMGVDLPEIGSSSFADWDGFRDESFRVPVLWLSLALFPRRFLPETLGLNLAMELSGVGGAYRSARDELRYYGFSSHFVDLHNTIDNVSTGHSAMAMEAIQIYLDGVIDSHDRRAVNLHWQRIWAGYLALVPPPESFMSRFYRSANYGNAAN
jgi:hypothetical protein